MSNPASPISRTIQVIWTTLLAAGQLTLVGTIFLVFKRNSLACRSALLNTVFFTLLTAIIYSLLLYGTGAFLNANPPRGVCAVQTILKHGLDSTSLWSIAFLLFESFIAIRTLLIGKSPSKYIVFCQQFRAHFLWINMVIWFLITSMSVFTDPDVILSPVKIGFYCAAKHSTINILQTDEMLVITAIMAGLLGLLYMVFR